jgi:hypothetical protein
MPVRIKTEPTDPFGGVRERFFWVVNAGKQVVCPCCDGLAQRYKRSIGSTMAALLIRTYWATKDGGDWVHIQSRTDAKGGDYAKLRYWGLVEARGDRQEDGNSSGYWRITDLGISFVEKRVKVYKYIYLYQGVYRGYDPNPRAVVSIDQVLGKRFSYEDLMAESAEPGPAVAR